MFFAFLILLQTKGVPNVGGECQAAAPTHNPQNQN